MVESSSPVGRVLSPRVALMANIALVMAGSTAGLLGIVDTVSGVLVVLLGCVGIAITLAGKRGG